MADERTFIQFRKEGITKIVQGGPLQQVPLTTVFGSPRLALATGLAGFDAPAGQTSRQFFLFGAGDEDSANDLVQRFGEDLWVVALEEGVLEVRGRIYRSTGTRRRERETRGRMDTLAPALEASLLTAARLPSFEWWFERGMEKPVLLRVWPSPAPGVRSNDDVGLAIPRFSSWHRWRRMSRLLTGQGLGLSVLQIRPDVRALLEGDRRGLLERGLLEREAEAQFRIAEIIDAYAETVPLLIPAAGVSASSVLKTDPALARIGSAMRQKLLEVLPARAAEVWLTSPTSMLDGAAPIDVLLDEPSRSDEVQSALDAFAAGVF